MCLGTTKRGEPRHPLYVAADTELVPWIPSQSGRDAEDERLREVLLQAVPAARKRLRAALQVLESNSPASTPFVEWSPVTGTESTLDPLVLSFPKCNATVDELVAALVAVNAHPDFDWMRWDGVRRYRFGFW